MREALLGDAKNADGVVASLHMADGTPPGFFALARLLLLRFPKHRWLYDAASLIGLLEPMASGKRALYRTVKRVFRIPAP